MKKSIMTSLVAMQMLAATAGQAMAADRIPLVDKIVITVNPQASISGPKFQDRTGHKQYGEQIISLVLDEAHKKAARYLEYGDYKGYYSFLILALTVPLQEGLYIHFRDVENDKDLCDPYVNEGTIIRDRNSKKTYDIFRQYLKGGATPFIADCDKVRHQSRLTQMMRAGKDASDMGIMQVSLRWHYPEFYAKGKMADVRKSINYGINHLYKGYRPVYANSTKYPCLHSSSSLDYEGLIRGIWSGQYNSGNTKIESVCRWDNPNSPYRAHDVHFKKNLEKILSAAKNGQIDVLDGFDVDLSGKYRSAVEEILNNYRTGSNSRGSLDQVLAAAQNI